MTEKHVLGRLQFTRGCNQNCVFCSSPPGQKELSFEEIKRELKKLKDEGVTEVMYTGGEPTERKDLLDILEFSKTFGFTETSIQTNGSNLYDIEYLKKFKTVPNIKFAISFHSYDKETFGKISGKPEHYERLIKGLHNLGELDISVYIATVINSLNYKHLKEHIKFIYNNFPHITHFSFNYIDPVYNAKKNEWTVPKFSETELYINRMVSFMKEKGLTFRIEKMPLCYMAGFEEYCSDIRRDVFDEKRITSFLREIEEKGEMEFLIEEGTHYYYSKACKSCKLNGLCAGINPNYVKIKGDMECYPVFIDPMEIVKRANDSKRAMKMPSVLFKERVERDLNFFKKAIELKHIKNNVYDTYSFYLMHPFGIKDEEFIFNKWKEYTNNIRSGKEKDHLSFYIHTPYCTSNCSYCVYPSTTLQSKNQLQEYVDYLVRMMKKYALLFKGLTFKTIYLGGGTPSIYSAEQLDLILKTLFSLYSFHKEGEKAIELNPATTTKELLKILEKFGFNKISIGVQSFSPRVLKINNRGYQTEENIKKVISMIKSFNLNYLTADLVLGLAGDTKEDFLMSFEKLCALKPNNISIYPLKSDTAYIKKRFGTKERFEDEYYNFYKSIIKGMLEISKKYGYFNQFDPEKTSYVAPFSFSKSIKGTKEIKYHYTHFNFEPYSNFSLGYFSGSRIVNSIDYFLTSKENPNHLFLKNFKTGEADFNYSVTKISPIFEKVKFIVKSFYNYWEVSLKSYKDLYGSELTDDFRYAIKALLYFGKIELTHEKLIFLKSDEKELYPYFLFFTGKENVIKKMKADGVYDTAKKDSY